MQDISYFTDDQIEGMFENCIALKDVPDMSAARDCIPMIQAAIEDLSRDFKNH